MKKVFIACSSWNKISSRRKRKKKLDPLISCFYQIQIIVGYEFFVLQDDFSLWYLCIISCRPQKLAQILPDKNSFKRINWSYIKPKRCWECSCYVIAKAHSFATTFAFENGLRKNAQLPSSLIFHYWQQQFFSFFFQQHI